MLLLLLPSGMRTANGGVAVAESKAKDWKEMGRSAGWLEACKSRMQMIWKGHRCEAQ